MAATPHRPRGYIPSRSTERIAGQASSPSAASAAGEPPRAIAIPPSERGLPRQHGPMAGLRVGDDGRLEPVSASPSLDLGRIAHRVPHLVVAAGDDDDLAGDPLDGDRRRVGQLGARLQAPVVQPDEGGRSVARPVPVVVVRDERQRDPGSRPRRSRRTGLAIGPRSDVGPHHMWGGERDHRVDPGVACGEQERRLATLARAGDGDPVEVCGQGVDEGRERLQRHLADPGRLAGTAEPADRRGRRPTLGQPGGPALVHGAARAGEHQHARPGTGHGLHPDTLRVAERPRSHVDHAAEPRRFLGDRDRGDARELLALEQLE